MYTLGWPIRLDNSAVVIAATAVNNNVKDVSHVARVNESCNKPTAEGDETFSPAHPGILKRHRERSLLYAKQDVNLITHTIR
jgi:hypothetical protein